MSQQGINTHLSFALVIENIILKVTAGFCVLINFGEALIPDKYAIVLVAVSNVINFGRDVSRINFNVFEVGFGFLCKQTFRVHPLVLIPSVVKLSLSVRP